MLAMLGTASAVWKETAFVFANVRASNIPLQTVSSLTKATVCDFQVVHSDYLIGISTRHMSFKQACLNLTESDDEKARLFTELETYALNELISICGWAQEKLEEYFAKSRSPKYHFPCNVSIHIIPEDMKVQRIAPQNSGDKNTILKEINRFTGFEHVHTTGRPYLDNYTPKTLAQDTGYKHGSLECKTIRESYTRKIRDLKLCSRLRRNYTDIKHIDVSWKTILKPASPAGDYPYKSHLIVPITFRDHVEKSRVREPRLKEVLKLRGDARAIFGYICIDSPESYYFEDKDPTGTNNADVNMVYVYADLLSLVYLAFLNYFDDSKTVASYKEVHPQG